jgi:thiol:disulfide interchange protein DsbC
MRDPGCRALQPIFLLSMKPIVSRSSWIMHRESFYYKETAVKKISVLILACLLAILPLSAHAFPPKKGDKPCIECHKLEKKDAEILVKKIVPTGNVTAVKESQVKGIWQIDVDAGEGKHGQLYLDFSKKFLIAGQIVPVEAIGKQPPPRKVDVSKIPLENAILLGSKDASKKVIVFSDPDCPYCRELHKVIKQILPKRSDIAFLVILNPLPMHKDAFKKAQAIQCSKSAEMLDDAFSGKSVPEPTCPATQIEKNKELAKSLDFGGTPTLVRDDGTVLSGYLPEERLLEWIDKKQ